MPFTWLGLGYDARIFKGVGPSEAQPTEAEEHPLLSSMALIIYALLTLLT
jgi:hypothetical protein